MVKDTVKLLSRSDTQVLLPNFNRNALSEGVKIHRVGKICDFQLKSPFISETVRDRLMVTMDH